MEDVTYTLVSINMYEVNPTSTGHYYCDILEINIEIWWLYDDYEITRFRIISGNFYSAAPYLTEGKKKNNYDERF